MFSFYPLIPCPPPSSFLPLSSFLPSTPPPHPLRSGSLADSPRGDIQALESALGRGLIGWQGLVRNIDYLDLDDGVKRAVGKWWRRWVKPAAGAGGGEDWYQGSEGSDGSSGDEADEEVDMEVEGGVGKVDVDEDGVAGLMGGL